MATIKAAWKRTVRVREYESETLELSVERGWDEAADGDAVKAAVDLDRQLALAGDALVAERLADRMGPSSSVGSTKGRPIEPDEFV